MNNFYTYLWLREDGTPYYVGKGHDERAFHKQGRTIRPPEDRKRIVIQKWDSEEQAFVEECNLIKKYGRLDNKTGCLENRSDGGEGKAEWRPRIAGMKEIPIIIDNSKDGQENLYKVMQCVARMLLKKYKIFELEIDEVANDLFIKWMQTGGYPKNRHPVVNGKPTKPSISLRLPIRKGMAYCIIRQDVKNYLSSWRRMKRLNTVPIDFSLH